MIDPKMWASLEALETAGEPGFLRGVVAQFLETSPERLRLVGEAAAAADWPALEREAHTLKGSASILGATRVAALCETLEGFGRERRPFEREPLLRELGEAWEAAKDELIAKTRRG